MKNARMMLSLLILVALTPFCYAQANTCKKALVSGMLSVEVCLLSETDKARQLEFKVGVTHTLKNISNEQIRLQLDDDPIFRSNLYIVRNGKAVFSDNRPPVWADDVSIPGSSFHDRQLNPGEVVKLKLKFRDLRKIVPELKQGFGDAADYQVYASTSFFFLREGESTLSMRAVPGSVNFYSLRIR